MSKMMRAWQQLSRGKGIDMKLLEIPVPEAKAGTVVVKNVFAAVNPVDWKRQDFISDAPLPAVQGVDGAGIVTAVGAGVTTVSVGDRVNYHGSVFDVYGSFAEYGLAPATGVQKVPEGVSLKDAAATPCAAWTAYLAVAVKLRVAAGDTILINGASGGVGSCAVQIAKAAKATVLATCSTPNIDFVKSLGADHVIDYRNENVSEKVLQLTNKLGVDGYFDAVTDQGETVADVVKFGGSFCTILGTPFSNPMSLFMKNISVHYVMLGAYHTAGSLPPGQPTMRDVGAACNEMLKNGSLKPNISKEYPFDELLTALVENQGGRTRGKIVIRIANEDA